MLGTTTFTPFLRCLAAAGLIALTLGACTTDEQWSTGREVDRPYRTADDRPTTPATRAGLGDPNHFFLMQAQHLNAMEIELSRIAVDRAADSDVRDFAEQMVDDHTQLQRDVQRIADRMDFNVPGRRDNARQMTMSHLQSLTGPEFDQEYLNLMIADHARAIALYETRMQQTTNSDLRNLADEALPVLRDHFEEARQLSMELMENSPRRR